MTQLEAERRWPYYCEVEDMPTPSAADFERGRRLSADLTLIWDAMLKQAVWPSDFEDDQNLSLRWSSLNRTRLMVLPSFPIPREVIRGDPFYEYTSPHEKSESKKALVISDIELLTTNKEEQAKPLVRAHSPSYRVPELPLVEVSTLHLGDHQIAVIKR